jgi:hypothetical protein
MVMTVSMPHRCDMMRLHVTVGAVMALGIPYGMGHCGGRREKHGCAGENACDEHDWVFHMHLHVETPSLHRGKGTAASVDA